MINYKSISVIFIGGSIVEKDDQILKIARKHDGHWDGSGCYLGVTPPERDVELSVREENLEACITELRTAGFTVNYLP